MPGIEFLKDWDLKKHGWPALVVVIVWAITELTGVFEPKDPSCINQVKYLQNQNMQLVNELIDERKQSIEKDTIIKRYRMTDSVINKNVISPAKEILKSKK